MRGPYQVRNRGIEGKTIRDCILYDGWHDKHGYARWGKTTVIRKLWERAWEPIPADKQLNHFCDNRACINLAHVYLGTAKENTGDMIDRGRAFMPWMLEKGKHE